METIGERIKQLRTEQEITLTKLAESAKLSTSYLSQIERDRTTPSLSALTNIAKAFGVGLRYFFEDSDGELARVTHADARRDGFDHEASVVRVRLTSDVGTDKVEAYRVTLLPGAGPEPLDLHPGEGFCFVLTGELTITVGDERFVLAAGDSIHYDALQPHTWGNEGDQPCTAIWCQSPPGRNANQEKVANLQRAPLPAGAKANNV
jgi:transcriptional regulator with XRE-family HTH domain